MTFQCYRDEVLSFVYDLVLLGASKVAVLIIWYERIIVAAADSTRMIRVRTHYSHQITAAAMQMAPMKFLRLRSNRVAMRRQSLKRQNIRSTTLRCL